MPELPGIVDTLAPIGMGGHGLLAIPLTAAQIAAPTSVILANVNATYYLNTNPYTRYTSDGVNLNVVAGSGSLSTQAVQAIADQEIAAASAVLNQLSNKTGQLPAAQVAGVTLGPTTYASVAAALVGLYGLIQAGGATAPVPNVAPSVSFPGGTGDQGETFTITPGTYTGTQPTSVGWNVISNGAIVLTISAGTTGVITAAMVTGARSFAVAEFFSWSGGVNVTGKTSVTYTLNAPAAIPAVITSAGLSGTAQVGQVLTGSVGSWTNTPTGYVKTFYRNGVSIATTTDAATTLTYTTVAADAGASITFGVFATNAASGTTAPYNGVIQSISSPLVIGGATAPSWTATGAVQPGWVNGIFQVGVLMTADFGAAANNPAVNGYSYQVLRDGVAILGASGSNVSGFTYTPVSADQDHQLSFTLTASNAAGSATTTTASVSINAATGGGGGTASFVGSTLGGRASGASGTTFTIAPHASVQSGDYGLLFITANSSTLNISSVDSSWVSAAASITTATPDGQETHIYKKVLTGSEPANYTVTLGIADYAEAVFVAYRGPTQVIDIQSNPNSATNASPVTVTYPSATTNAINQTAVVFASMDVTASAAANWAQPSGFTQRNQADFLVPPYGYVVASDKVIAASGATGTFAAVNTTTATGNGWHAWTVILG